MVQRPSSLVAPAGLFTLLLCASCAAPAGSRAALHASLPTWAPPLEAQWDRPQEGGAASVELTDEETQVAVEDMVAVEATNSAEWPPVAGRHALSFSSGWAFFEAEVELTDVGGELGGETGSDDSELRPVIGGAVKYNYFCSENFALGVIAELRTFDATSVQPLTATISPDVYTSLHLLVSSRFYTDPLDFMPRAKLFGGLDLGYVPGIALEADVIFDPANPSLNQTVSLEGDRFATLGIVGGASVWVGDIVGHDVSVEFGAFYERAIDPSEDTITLQIPNGLGGLTPNDVDGDVISKGVIMFFGATLYL